MRRADRLFQIVRMLRSRPVTTGGRLAEDLGVSKRTIYRDVQDLQRSGVPIRGEAGVGYALDKRFDLPPMTFSSVELEGLALGARIVAAWGDPELASAVGSAMNRIEAVLPSIGRIELPDSNRMPILGTGFVVGKDLLMGGKGRADTGATWRSVGTTFRCTCWGPAPGARSRWPNPAFGATGSRTASST